MHRTKITERLKSDLLRTPDSWDSTLPERLWFAGEQNTDQGLVLVSRNGQETKYTWTDILDRSRKTATLLQRRGVQFGDRVAIVLPTCIEFFDVFFGLQILGAIPVPLYPPSD